MNYGKEYIKFEKRMKNQAQEYLKAGMNSEQIEAIYQFDKEQFLSDLRYYRHNISLESCETISEDMNSLMKKYPEAFASKKESDLDNDRYAWINEIEDPTLYAMIKSLSAKDIELLTLYAFEGYTQKQTADILGISQQTVSNRIKSIAQGLLMDKAC